VTDKKISSEIDEEHVEIPKRPTDSAETIDSGCINPVKPSMYMVFFAISTIRLSIYSPVINPTMTATTSPNRWLLRLSRLPAPVAVGEAKV
jgi:hypothetical protein